MPLSDLLFIKWRCSSRSKKATIQPISLLSVWKLSWKATTKKGQLIYYYIRIIVQKCCTLEQPSVISILWPLFFGMVLFLWEKALCPCVFFSSSKSDVRGIEIRQCCYTNGAQWRSSLLGLLSKGHLSRKGERNGRKRYLWVRYFYRKPI